MSRQVIIAPEGYINMSGSLYGRYIYPASTQAVSNMLEVAEQDVVNLPTTANSSADGLQFWANFQQCGARTDYSYAFANWSNTSIVPLYGMNNVDKCMYALMNCKNLVDGRSITFNISSMNPNMMYVCANCVSMTNAPHFIYSNTNIVRTYTSMYAGCSSLRSVTVFWGNGESDPISERSSCQNMFFKCSALQEIDFGEPNTGSPIDLDLSATDVLSQASLASLANSLMNVTGADSGNFDIKVSHEVYVAMTEELKQLFTDKGWTLVVPES